MKKPLVALAALVFTTLVSAQSSVTLYGIADFWVGSSTHKSTTAASGGLAASRWGIKGKEDLGDGLEAGFVLEQVFDLASGAAAGGFNRQSYVSLAGSFGELRLGNVLAPLDDINGSANSGGDSLLAAISGVWVGFNTNPLRQIYYATPEVGGLGAAVSRSLSGQRGREVPVSDALVVSTGYARSTDKSADLQVAQRQGYGLLLTYSLSKRTALYGGLQRNTEKMTNNTARLTAAGIHHTF
jgi:predicted porin